MTAPAPQGGGLAAKLKGRKIIVLIVVAGAGYVGWQWWQSRGAGAATPAVTGDVGAPIDASGVVGAPASGNVQYAGTTQDNTSANVIDTNAEWTADAVEKLGAGGYDTSAVYAALGDYLARRPLTQGEQTIVRAAIAASGPPPVGGPYTVIEQSGPLTMAAPTGLKVTSVSRTSVALAWNPVDGAQLYYVYQGGHGGDPYGSRDTKASIGGLKAATRYTFQVAATTTTGKIGPKSSTVTVTTKK